MYAVKFMPTKFAEPETIYDRLFSASSWEEIIGARDAWLREDFPGHFWGSKPMQYLMSNLREQVRRSLPSDEYPQPVKLKHESFLAVLNEALAMEGWSEKDHVPRNVLERLTSRVFDMPGSNTGPTKRPHRAAAPHRGGAEGSRAGAHKRVQETDGEEDQRPKKRRRVEEVRQSRVALAIELRAAPSSTAKSSLTKRPINVRPAAEGRSRSPSHALLAKVMRSRCCGFWRHVLRR